MRNLTTRHAPAAALIAGLTACGGSPTAPPPPPPPPPAAQTWVLAGTVTDAATGVPVAGASLSFSTLNQTATTGSDGAWSVTGSGTAASRLGLTLSAGGYLTYETGVRWDVAGRRDIGIALIPDRSPFSLTYYREFVRNGMEEPENLRPVLRWTATPNFYVDTFNPRTGQPLEPAEVDMVVRAIRSAVPQLTGGRYEAGNIETGVGPLASRTNYINLSFIYEPNGEFCGQALVGANPGRITINYDRCASVCGSLKVTPETIIHEVGHAMGFWHTTGSGVMSPTRVRSCGNVNFSSQEQFHANLAYGRPRGNMNLDVDPGSFSNSTTGSGPVVICRR